MAVDNSLIYFITITFIVCCLKRWFRGTNYNGQKQDLSGKVAVVTGGASGIGQEIVHELAAHQCTVIIADISDTILLAKYINQKMGKQLVYGFRVDLGSRKSIEQFAMIGLNRWHKIDYLVNNAGVLTCQNRIMYTKDGKQMHYGVNFIGHFLLTHYLWQKLNNSQGKFRIINTSSITHKKKGGFFEQIKIDFENLNFEDIKFDYELAYGRSKLYITLITHSLAEKAQDKGIVVSVHPGIVRSQMMKKIFPGLFLTTIYYLSFFFIWVGTKSCKEGHSLIFIYYFLHKSRQKMDVIMPNVQEILKIQKQGKKIGINFSIGHVKCLRLILENLEDLRSDILVQSLL